MLVDGFRTRKATFLGCHRKCDDELRRGIAILVHPGLRAHVVKQNAVCDALHLWIVRLERVTTDSVFVAVNEAVAIAVGAQPICVQRALFTVQKTVAVAVAIERIESKRQLSEDLLEGGAGLLLTELKDGELLEMVALDINKALEER